MKRNIMIAVFVFLKKGKKEKKRKTWSHNVSYLEVVAIAGHPYMMNKNDNNNLQNHGQKYNSF